jgi:hypothetical protein
MYLANTKDTIIATGYNCLVQAKEEDVGDDWNTIAMVASFQANEDFQVQDAIVIGNLGPISVDPQGYTCSITLDGFLPAKRILDGVGPPEEFGGGKKAPMDYVPTRKSFMSEDGIPQKLHALRFINKKGDDGEVTLAKFTGVIVTSSGVSCEGNSYVRNNVQMRALSWDKDKD